MGMVSQSRAIPVLITRPMPQADRFARALRDRYKDRVVPILTPLLAATLLYPDLPEGSFRSVILTSETGARAAAAFARQLPKRAYCVGDRTAQVAQDLGFQTISADGDADRLFHLLLTRPNDAPFLHLRGREARGDLVARLVTAGLGADQAVVYAQEPQDLSAEAISALSGNQPVIAPLFSPRSAELFRRALGALPNRTSVRIVALSPEIAKIFADIGPESLGIATEPTQAELFLALDRFIITA